MSSCVTRAYDPSGSCYVLAVYADLPGVWGAKFSLRRSGASHFYLPDHQGNSGQLADSTETVTDTLLTDAWGVQEIVTGSTVNPFEAFGQWGYYRDTVGRLYAFGFHLRTDLGRLLAGPTWEEAGQGIGTSYVPRAAPPPVGGKSANTCPGALPNDDPQHLPGPGWLAQCAKCGGKAVWVRCYDDKTCKKLRSQHRSNEAAVYCIKGDRIYSPHYKRVCDATIACNYPDAGRLGTPVFKRPTNVCLWGVKGPQNWHIGDCGCGPHLKDKPVNGNWIDVCIKGCEPGGKNANWRNRWTCVVPGKCPARSPTIRHLRAQSTPASG